MARAAAREAATWRTRLGGARLGGARRRSARGRDVARAAGRGAATATQRAGVQGHGEVGACQHRRGR